MTETSQFRAVAGAARQIRQMSGVLIVILGPNDGHSSMALASLSIGPALTRIHLISIPIDNMSVDLTRSTRPALFVDSCALSQLWPFWRAPLTRVAAAGLIGRRLFSHPDEDRTLAEEALA